MDTGAVLALGVAVQGALMAAASHGLIDVGEVTWTLLFYVIVAVAPFASSLRRRRIRVGADGVAVVRGSRSRFFPYATLRGAYPLDGGVRFLANGLVDTVWTGRTGELLEAIAEAKHAYDERAATRLPDALARGNRSDEEWDEVLKRAMAGTDYRHAPVVPLLVRVVENPASDAEERAAAAAALRAHPDTERVLAAAAADTADPVLHAALAEPRRGALRVVDRSARALSRRKDRG